MGTQYQFTVVKMKLIVLIALIGLVAATPNPYPEEEYGPANGLRIPDYHPYVQKKNTVQLTDSEFQTTTTKKDTARDTTTQDATEEDATEEDHASGDAEEVVTAEEVTLRDAESSTVNKVEHQERTTFENVFICVCSLLAVNKITN